MAAQAVSAFQTIRSRNLNPLEPSVITVGIVRGGTRFNIIPAQVHLEGTVRTYNPDVRDAVERPGRSGGVPEDQKSVFRTRGTRLGRFDGFFPDPLKFGHGYQKAGVVVACQPVRVVRGERQNPALARFIDAELLGVQLAW